MWPVRSNDTRDAPGRSLTRDWPQEQSSQPRVPATSIGSFVHFYARSGTSIYAVTSPKSRLAPPNSTIIIYTSTHKVVATVYGHTQDDTSTSRIVIILQIRIISRISPTQHGA